MSFHVLAKFIVVYAEMLQLLGTPYRGSTSNSAYVCIRLLVETVRGRDGFGWWET